MENKEVFDWKKELEFLKSMLKDECDRHDAEVKRINEQAKKVIDLAGKDAQQTWNEILEEFSIIGQKINWMKYRYWYIGIAVVLFFLIMHYVFGI